MSRHCDSAPFCDEARDERDRLRAALRIWLDYAEQALPEFTNDEPCPETLCPQCREVGCIQMKVNAARAALGDRS